MKNICIVRQGFSDDVRVRKEAFALVEKGYDVDLICLKREEEKKFDVINTINVYRIPMKRTREGVLNYISEYIFFLIIAFFKLTFLFIKKRYNCIQVNTLPDFLVFCTIIPKIFGSKIILDLHEPSPELFGTIFGRERKILIAIIKFFEKTSIKFADHAITVSENMYNNHLKKGVPPEKMSVVLNVPNVEFEPNRYNIEKPENEFVIISHGAMLKRYGQDIAIRAIDIVRKTIPQIRFFILGYGDYENALKELANKLELNEHVKFFGYIPYIDMIKMLKRADVGIVPIRRNPYSDLVHTNKMFEYIAMKKPVIITRTKAVEDYFNTCTHPCLSFFESGNEAELASCIVELYNNPGMQREMVINAYKHFESVKWEKVKEKYCSIFD